MKLFNQGGGGLPPFHKFFYHLYFFLSALSQDACFTEIRRGGWGNEPLITKRCKQGLACHNNYVQVCFCRSLSKLHPKKCRKTRDVENLENDKKKLRELVFHLKKRSLSSENDDNHWPLKKRQDKAYPLSASALNIYIFLFTRMDVMRGILYNVMQKHHHLCVDVVAMLILMKVVINTPMKTALQEVSWM